MLAPAIIKLRVTELVNDAGSFEVVLAALALTLEDAAVSFGSRTPEGRTHMRNARRLRVALEQFDT